MSQDNSRLLYTAADCVKATGECVAKTKWVIEKIGDFEYEFDGSLGIDLDLGVLDITRDEQEDTAEREKTCSVSEASSISESVDSSTGSETPVTAATTPVARGPVLPVDKPLPEVPPAVVTVADEKRESQYSLPPSSTAVPACG